MNLAWLLQRSAAAEGDRPAVALGVEPLLSYRALAHRVAVLAHSLRHRLGLEAGERVALIMHNDPAAIELLFASWHAGLTVVPVNAKLHSSEFSYILAHSSTRACFATAELAEILAGLSGDLPELKLLFSVADSAYEALFTGEEMARCEVAPGDLAWLFYTSGTTGKPKGAMLSHQNLWAMTASYFADVEQIAPGDAIIHAAPMSHGSGLYALPHVAQAACHVIPGSRGFEPGELLDLIAAWPGTTFFAAPTMVKRLAEAPEAAAAESANLKTIVYGGGPMYQADLAKAHDVFGFKLAQIYGQGESPMTITALNKARHAAIDHPRYSERLASVGTAQLAVEVRVADPEGRSLPAKEVGEILVRGPSVMRGYWQNPEATAAALKDGWLWTGDMGVLDADGFLTLRDRSKDLIISGGSNIYPREVEEVLLRHPDVAEVAVVGAPDPQWGERVVAFVVAAPGAMPGSATLDAFCLVEMARFKRPKSYRFLPALPKNNYGKVLKTELRGLFQPRRV